MLTNVPWKCGGRLEENYSSCEVESGSTLLRDTINRRRHKEIIPKSSCVVGKIEHLRTRESHRASMESEGK